MGILPCLLLGWARFPLAFAPTARGRPVTRPARLFAVDDAPGTPGQRPWALMSKVAPVHGVMVAHVQPVK